MGTGASFARITNKRILGHTDLDDWFLQYLRTSHAESVIARWGSDGVFDTKLTLSAPGADTVQVDGTSLATEGAGHLLDVAEVYPDRTALFENTAAIVYEVGLSYAEVPEEIRINPRTGKPEYDHTVEQIAESADPDAVVDNGNGTITFTVNSVTESGVTSAGRLVRVYKKLPADDALTAAVAIEELTVSYSGGNNKITTVAALGQTAISTTASDYTVVLMGVSVKRNTSIQGSPGFVFVGTVTGNGGTPTVFSNALQPLFKTFQDASQITFTPYLYITSTDVQAAIEEVVDDLGAAGSASAGATRVGIDGTVLTKRLATAVTDDMGLGNVNDGTFTSSSDLQDAMVEIDAVLARRRSCTLTLANGATRTEADITGTDVLHEIQDADTKFAKGGTYWLQRGQYLVGDASNTGFAGDNYPYIIGEEHGPSPIHGVEVRLNAGGVTADHTLLGRWMRTFFQSANATYKFKAGAGFVAEDCNVVGGDLVQDSLMDTRQSPFEYRRVVFDDNGSGTLGVAFAVDSYGGTKIAYGLVENCVFTGPQSGHASPIATLHLNDLGTSLVNTGNRPLTFRNCVVIQGNLGVPALKLDNLSPVVFEDCVFIGGGASTVPLVVSSNAQASFKNCHFHATAGQALQLSNHMGTFENCVVTSGTNTAVSSPVLIEGRGAAVNHPLIFKNLYVELSSGCVRATGATKALMEFGGTGGNSSNRATYVDGLYATVQAAPTALHSYSTAIFHGSDQGNVYRNIHIDLGLKEPGVAITAGVVSFPNVGVYRSRVEGLTIEGIANPTAALTTTPFLVVDQCEMRDVRLYGFGGGSGRYQDAINVDSSYIDGLILETDLDVDNAMVAFGSDCVLKNTRLKDAAVTITASQLFHMPSGSDGNLVDGLVAETWRLGTVGFQNDGAHNSFTNVTIDTGTITQPVFAGGSGGTQTRVTDCTVKVTGDPQVLNLSGAECIVMANIFVSSTGTATIANTGGSSLGNSSHNVIT